MKIKDPEALAYYLSRSVFRLEDGFRFSNIVAEEAECGNELAIRAMNARKEVLKSLTKKGENHE